MTIMLGIDTGGTYTDAVLFEKGKGVKKASKSLTTKHDLAIGITNACSQVLQGIDMADIALVSLSSTLATNAIVEKQGSPICLIMAGHSVDALNRANLKDALNDDPAYFIDGGHTASGTQKMPLDEKQVKQIANKYKNKVSAFAICSMFAVRNPEHENRMREIIRNETGLPVTASHDLASSLDAPRRALTAVLNARLISQLHHLITAVGDFLKQHNINAPFMVVQGNGSLMTAEVALEKPVETIMSGPAASVIGASYLTGEQNVFVADIGGTTTDVAVIENGLPVLSPNGAVVHGWHTMVEAVGVYTIGLGGDSELSVDDDNMLKLGTRRATPISLLATQYPNIKPILQAQLDAPTSRVYDGIFAHRLRTLDTAEDSLSNSEKYFWDTLADCPQPLTTLLSSGRAPKPLYRLADRGLIIFSSFTPSDAVHILDLQNDWDKQTAIIAGEIWAKKERKNNQAWAENATDFAQQVIDQMTLQSGEALLASAYIGETGVDLLNCSKHMQALVRCSLSNTKNKNFSLNVNFKKPIVAIGAPAKTYYPNIAKSLNTELIIPDYAYTANAVGAIAGNISKTVSVTISSPADGAYRVHIDKNHTFTELDKAINCATLYAMNTSVAYVKQNLGTNIDSTTSRKDRIVRGSGKDIFIESIVSVRTTGEPKIK